MAKMNWSRLRDCDRMRRDAREDMSTARMLWLLERDNPEAPARRYIGKRERAHMQRLGQEWLTRQKKRQQRPSIDDINLLLAEARRKPAQ